MTMNAASFSSGGSGDVCHLPNTFAVFETFSLNKSSCSRVASSLSLSLFCILDALRAYKRLLNSLGDDWMRQR